MGREGPNRVPIYEVGGDAAIAIAGEVTVYSAIFDLSKGTNFAVELLAAGTTVNLKVELEQGHKAPTTAGSADTTNWSVPSGASDIIDGLTQKTHFIKSVSPVTSKYGRLKILGKTGNTADVTLAAYLVKLEDA